MKIREEEGVAGCETGRRGRERGGEEEEEEGVAWCETGRREREGGEEGGGGGWV